MESSEIIDCSENTNVLTYSLDNENNITIIANALNQVETNRLELLSRDDDEQLQIFLRSIDMEAVYDYLKSKYKIIFAMVLLTVYRIQRQIWFYLY